MPYIEYETFKFHPKSARQIEQAVDIIAEYRGQGYTLSLRQLYYQFVSRDYIPNTEASYNNLGVLITKARMAGLIDWYAIEDRGRGVISWLIEPDESAPLDGIEQGFALDYWEQQGKYVEVWVEKDALSSVIRRPCEQFRVPYMACKGYLSASEAWRAGQRFKEMADEGRECILIHLGDHDPSGIDMTRDNSERLDLFAGSEVEIRRIALNMDQVRQYNPPPNPAKLTDKRAASYIDNYGNKSWELDALQPSVIEKLVRDEIEGMVDFGEWRDTEAAEQEGRKSLAKLHSNWDAVRDFVMTLPD